MEGLKMIYCDIEWVDQCIPRVLPAGWNLAQCGVDGAQFIHPARRLRVIVSGDTEQDGRRWYHVSASHEKRIPDYEELKLVKELFIGKDKKAIQVFTPIAEHVNICPRVLHLWHCVDGDPFPDFTRGLKTL